MLKNNFCTPESNKLHICSPSYVHLTQISNINSFLLKQRKEVFVVKAEVSVKIQHLALKIQFNNIKMLFALLNLPE